MEGEMGEGGREGGGFFSAGLLEYCVSSCVLWKQLLGWMLYGQQSCTGTPLEEQI